MKRSSLALSASIPMISLASTLEDVVCGHSTSSRIRRIRGLRGAPLLPEMASYVKVTTLPTSREAEGREGGDDVKFAPLALD